MKQLLTNTYSQKFTISLLLLIAITVIGSLYAWHKTHIDYLLAAPLGLILVAQLIYNYRVLFYALILGIPCSMHLELGSFSIDTSEPLMLIMTFVFLLNILSGKQFSLKEKIYPLHVFIFLLIFWVLITTVTSEIQIRSLKFFLAKIWYIATFVFIADKIVEKIEHFKIIFWCFLIPLTIGSFITTIIHGLNYNFSFEGGFAAPYYIFTNHVIYGAILVLFLPYVWYARDWYEIGSLYRLIINICLGIILVGVVLSYGRLAWLSAVILPILVFIIRQKWLDKLIYVAVFVLVLGISYLVKDNNFYKFAPDFKKTIFHEGDFDAHLSATFSGTDMSGVERFYRWAAAKNMIAARPVFGFGPSTFNKIYKQYTEDAFRTYVSDNPEQSTTHNYLLMTCSEQGFIGLFIFASLIIFMTIRGFKTYHLCKKPENKRIVLMVTLSLMIIILQSAINELIEVDKVGTIFWFNMMMIHKVEKWEES